MQACFGVIATELRQSASLFLAPEEVVAQETTRPRRPENRFCLTEKVSDARLKPAAKTVLPLASAAIVVNGLQGTYLHWRGIAARPGGWTLYNMESGPPVFAPLLASLVGGMGLLAAVLRREGREAEGRR